MALGLVLLICLWLPPKTEGATALSTQKVEPTLIQSAEFFSLLENPIKLSPRLSRSSSPYKAFSFVESKDFHLIYMFLILNVIGVSAWAGYSLNLTRKEENVKDNCPISPISVCSTSLPSSCSPKSLDLNEPTGLGLFSWNEVCEDLVDNGSYSRNFDEVKLLWQNQEESVFLARHKLDTEEYLVKAMPLSICPNQSVKDSALFQEINKIKKINCRHVARYVTCWIEESKDFNLDSNTYDIVLYIQMEFIQGDSVSSLLKQDLSKSKALKIISQVCKIVNFLHYQCIAHGDLSPDNIFINKYGSVVIGDFNMKNCFCDDQRSILELIKHLVEKVGDPEGMQSEILKNQFIQNSKLTEQVIYVIRNN